MVMICIIGVNERDPGIRKKVRWMIRNKDRDARKEGGKMKNHNARRAGRRREKLSYLCCNRGKGAFADWSCHGNGWHLVYVCVWLYLSVQGFVYMNVLVSIWKCLLVCILYMCVCGGGGGGLNGGSCWGIISVVKGKWGRGPERHNKAPLACSVDGKHTVNIQAGDRQMRDVDLLHWCAGNIVPYFHIELIEFEMIERGRDGWDARSGEGLDVHMWE